MSDKLKKGTTASASQKTTISTFQVRTAEQITERRVSSKKSSYSTNSSGPPADAAAGRGLADRSENLRSSGSTQGSEGAAPPAVPRCPHGPSSSRSMQSTQSSSLKLSNAAEAQQCRNAGKQSNKSFANVKPGHKAWNPSISSDVSSQQTQKSKGGSSFIPESSLISVKLTKPKADEAARKQKEDDVSKRFIPSRSSSSTPIKLPPKGGLRKASAPISTKSTPECSTRSMEGGAKQGMEGAKQGMEGAKKKKRSPPSERAQRHRSRRGHHHGSHGPHHHPKGTGSPVPPGEGGLSNEDDARRKPKPLPHSSVENNDLPAMGHKTFLRMLIPEKEEEFANVREDATSWVTSASSHSDSISSASPSPEEEEEDKSPPPSATTQRSQTDMIPP